VLYVIPPRVAAAVVSILPDENGVKRLRLSGNQARRTTDRQGDHEFRRRTWPSQARARRGVRRAPEEIDRKRIQKFVFARRRNRDGDPDMSARSHTSPSILLRDDRGES